MNNYRIISDIGSGAYSTVHKAIDVTTGHIVAIKKISQQNMNIKHIINREVAFLHQCINHPNIIQLEKCFSLGSFTYLVFQYMPMDLISYYKSVQESRKRNLNDEEICFISYQLCNALKFLHDKRIMHRDIKPQNVLIDPDTLKIKLIDFGFAKQKSSQLNTNYMVTRWYRPIQIVLNLPYDQKIDVFATGSLMLELYLGNQIFRSSSNIDQFYWITKICGNPPIGWSEAHQAINKLNLSLESSFPQLNQYLKNIRPLAADLITKMLKTSPHQRISMSQVFQHPYFARFKIKSAPILNKQLPKLIRPFNDIVTNEQLLRNPSLKRNRAFSTQQQTYLPHTFFPKQLTTRTQASQNSSLPRSDSAHLKTFDGNQNTYQKNQYQVNSKKYFIKRVSRQKDQSNKSKDFPNAKNQNKGQQKSKGLRNRVKSMTGHGINVVSLKKLKVHRDIDKPKQKSRGKEQYKTNQGQILRLNPKKDRPMFLKVKQKINDGRFNDRGQERPQQVISPSGRKLPISDIATKISSSAQLKVRKIPQYKEYMFKQ